MNKKTEIPLEIISKLQEVISLNLQEEIIPGQDLIPAAAPSIESEDIINSIESLCQGWLTEGNYCHLFEKKTCEIF